MMDSLLTPYVGSVQVPVGDGLYAGVCNMSYLQWGDKDNEDVVVCVHGLTRNAWDFAFLADELCKKFRVIAVDMPGRGGSGYFKDHRMYFYDVYYHMMIFFLRSLGIASCNYIGTSMGGLIGVLLSSRCDGLFKKFVLNDIGPSVSRDAMDIISSYISLQPGFSDLDEAEEYFRVILANCGIKSDVVWKVISEKSVIKVGDVYKCAFDAGVVKAYNEYLETSDGPFDCWSDWNAINPLLPMLLLWGKESKVLTVEIVDLMTSGGKNLDVIAYGGVGHPPCLAEDYMIRDVESWLLR